ncbi:MAG: RDD family protein, partial [Solirubrobacterales bacterium]
ESGAAERATDRVLASDATKRIWEKVLASEEAQLLVERVAEAPEVRSAITAQGVGLLEDIRRGLRRAARQLDTAVERVARTVVRRPPRPERPIYAGAVSRLLALAIDAGVVYGSLLLISAAIALLVSVLSPGEQGAGTVVLAFGAAVWFLIACAYLAFFWSGAGRTPGMSFVGLRIVSLDGEGIPPGRAIRRAVWLPISALPMLLGYRGILFDEMRRGWPDRRAHTVVLYADPKLDRELGKPTR